jgi:hypothetical protein
VTSLEAQARESFLVDVTAVGEELSRATDPDAFALLLAELVELCSRDRLLVSHTGDGKLATGGLLIRVARA